MCIVEISDPSDQRIRMFSLLTDAQLRNRIDPDNAVFIAESPKVIRVALDAGISPVAILCEKKHINGDARDIIQRLNGVPVFTGTRETLANITGYKLTRGVLCAMKRPPLPSVADLCTNSKRIVVIHDVCDATNTGAIFRSAAALGIDAVLLNPSACDPLNRRSVRVSMGSVFLIPWTFLPDGISQLKDFGFKTAAMALRDNSIDINDHSLKNVPRLAVILGTEGDGLPSNIIDSSDFVVKIPMHNGVDSLNVAAASAIACFELAIHHPLSQKNI